MIQKNIGEYIAKLRKEKNLTQQQLAEQIYVTRQAVSKWEQGKTFPDSESLARLSKVFKVPIEEILFHAYQIDNVTNDDLLKQQLELQTISNSSLDSPRILNDEGKNTFDKFTTNNIIINLYNSYNEYYIKSKKRFYIIIIIIITFILSLVSILAIHLYNSVSVYNIFGENSSFSVTDGMIFLTNEKYYFQIGQIISKKEENINNLELYYYNKDQERITMYKTNNFNNAGIFLRDYLGYNAYFNLNSLDAMLNSLSIDYILEDGTVETLNLRLEKEKINKVFSKSSLPEVIEGTNITSKYEINDLNQFIKKNFKKNDDGYQYIKKENNKSIVCDYIDDMLMINITDENVMEIWQFDLMNNCLSYQKYEDNVFIEEVSIDLNNISDNNKEYYSNFEEILNKIKSNFS
ncbi:MAG: helix-turn-helix transcriptional regulator [Bacilli bacterium]|nr:helix-turn-helix transcriptional regulator [Bacilli bacterium]